MGNLIDRIGHRFGVYLYCIFYMLSVLSLQSNRLLVLFAGRLAGGLGTSLLAAAPESWVVSKFQDLKDEEPSLISQIFSWAYAGDSLVAIAAGLLATSVATRFGPMAPFKTSATILAITAAFLSFLWSETSLRGISQTNPTYLMHTVKACLSDYRLVSLGAVQALFEGAMYTFVLHWPPAIRAVFESSHRYSGFSIPYGSIFSCFMASCLLGSTLHSVSRQLVSPEIMVTIISLIATLAMALVRIRGINHLPLLLFSLFIFEMAVGMYFPVMSSLRAKYLPDSQRSTLMTLFGVPLNLFVVAVFLNTHKLGIPGAFTCATAALGAASLATFALHNNVAMSSEDGSA